MSKPEPPSGASTGPRAVALIAGPTASGKSDLAVELALELERRGRRGVVINADSAQVYRDLRILSARPSEAEMRGVEHRLFGAWDGAQACSAAAWALAAKREIAEVHATGGVPILVGGTGLYLRTLLDGIAPVPEIDPGVRSSVRGLDTSEAYAALLVEDRPRAETLKPQDSARIARALEVVRSTGRPLAHWQAQQTGGIACAVSLHALILLPERAALFARCDARFAAMLDNGATEEVARLLERRLNRSLPIMRAIGVPEITAWLQGNLSRAEALEGGQQATRNYAKRQFTWFRGQTPAEWTKAEDSTAGLACFETLFRKIRLT